VPLRSRAKAVSVGSPVGIPPPSALLDREGDVIAAVEPRQPGAQVLPVGQGDLAAPHLPAR
jgi:hypothetical protein